MTATMPVQRPGRSRQDYETPADLLESVVTRWGPIQVDLAATFANAKAPLFLSDSLNSDWSAFDGICWLNPEFANIKPWARKSAESGARVIMLTPASVGSNWFRDHVAGKARVYFLNPRLTFVGCDNPYPKDTMLSVFNIEPPGFEVWRWK